MSKIKKTLGKYLQSISRKPNQNNSHQIIKTTKSVKKFHKVNSSNEIVKSHQRKNNNDVPSNLLIEGVESNAKSLSFRSF